MQKYENEHAKKWIDDTMNLHLDSLERGSKIMMGVDFGYDGGATVICEKKGHQLTVLTHCTDIDLKISNFLLLRLIAEREMQKNWFYGASQYVKLTAKITLLRLIRALNKHRKLQKLIRTISRL